MNLFKDFNSELNYKTRFFENGFVALHAKMPHQAASLRLCVRTGSLDEAEFSGTGISHFVEHMLFNGAGKRDKREFASFAASIGARTNAYTSYDRTVYTIDIPTSHLKNAIGLLADMVCTPHLDEKSFETEREVIFREIDMCDDDPDEVLFSNLVKKIYTTYPLRHPIIGTKSGFESISLDDLKAYFKRRYVPQNMFIVGVSNLEDEDFFKLVEQSFSEMPFGRYAVAMRDEEDFQTASRKIEVNTDCDVCHSSLAFRLPKLNARSSLAIDAFAFALGGGNSARLVREIKYDMNLVDSIDAEVLRAGDETLLIISWICALSKRQAAESAIRLVLMKNINAGINEDELKKYEINCIAALANVSRNSSLYADFIANSYFIGMDTAVGFDYINMLESIGANAISRICRDNISFASSVYASVEPSESQGEKKVSISQTQLKSEIVKLSNGLRVVLIPNDDFKKVHLRITSIAGAQVLNGELCNMQGLAALSILRDTSKRTAEELSKFIEDNAMSFNSRFGDAYASVFGESLAQDYEKIFEIFDDAFNHLQIDKNTFETERSALISDILDDLEDPFNAAFYAMREDFFKGNPLAFSPDGKIDVIAKATPDKIVQIIKKFFCADTSIVSVCGNFDKSKIIKACENAFGKLEKSNRDMKCLLDKPWNQEGNQFSKTVEIGKLESVIFGVFECNDMLKTDNVATALVVQEILGGEDGIVFERVREREAMAYGAGASSICAASAGAFYFYASSKKKYLNRIEEIFRQIAQETASGKFFDSERFNSARLAAKARVSDILQDPSARAYACACGLLSRNRFEDEQFLCSEIDKVTVESAIEFAKKTFKNPSIFKAI